MAEQYFTSTDIDTRPVIISRTQARTDHALYVRLKAEAAKRGSELQIVEDAEWQRLQGREPDPTPMPERLDDGTVEIDGRRAFPIPRTKAQDHPTYLKFREMARSLGAELAIVDDDFFDPGPEAA